MKQSKKNPAYARLLSDFTWLTTIFRVDPRITFVLEALVYLIQVYAEKKRRQPPTEAMEALAFIKRATKNRRQHRDDDLLFLLDYTLAGLEAIFDIIADAKKRNKNVSPEFWDFILVIMLHQRCRSVLAAAKKAEWPIPANSGLNIRMNNTLTSYCQRAGNPKDTAVGTAASLISMMSTIKLSNPPHYEIMLNTLEQFRLDISEDELYDLDRAALRASLANNGVPFTPEVLSDIGDEASPSTSEPAETEPVPQDQTPAVNVDL